MNFEELSAIHLVFLGIAFILVVLIFNFVGDKYHSSKKKKLLKQHKSFFYQMGKYRSERPPEKYNWLPLEALHESIRIEQVEDVFQRRIADHLVMFFETKLRIDSSPLAIRYDHFIDNGFFLHFPETKLQSKNVLLCPPLRIPGNLSLFIVYILSAVGLYLYVREESGLNLFLCFAGHTALFYFANIMTSGLSKFKSGRFALKRLKHLLRLPVQQRFLKYSLVDSESNTVSARWLEALYSLDQKSPLKGVEYFVWVKNGKLTLGLFSKYDFFSEDRLEQGNARRSLENELRFIENLAANTMREIQGKRL